MSKHISIDVESLATSPDAILLSIGAVYFDTNGLYDTFYSVLDIGADQVGRRTCDSTLKWWEEQSEEAREALMTEQRERVLFALGRLHEFIHTHDHEGIWALGSHFDIAALEHLHLQKGVPIPWHYQTPRDMRTLRALFLKQFPSSQLVVRTGTPHNALDDAVNQARAIQYMNQQLGGYVL